MKIDALYFIPILRRALEESDWTNALSRAVERIRKLGDMPEYEIGLKQFGRLMDLVRSLSDESEVPSLKVIGDRSGLDSLELDSDPTLPGEERLELEFQVDGVRTESIHLRPSGTQQIENLQPGTFRLSLGSGRVLWQSQLSLQDLYWTHAFPGQPIPAAAMTGDEAPSDAARTLSTSAPDIVLTLRPGAHGGYLLIAYRPEQHS